MQTLSPQLRPQTQKWIKLGQQSQALNLTPWSFSKLTALTTCPRNFQYTYIAYHPRTSTPQHQKYQAEPAVVGEALHKVLELSCHQLNAQPGNIVMEKFSALFTKTIRAYHLTTKEEAMAFKQRPALTRLVKRLIRAAEKYHLEIIPEACLVMDIKKGYFTTDAVLYKDRMFTTYIDFLGLNKEQTRALIIDYKSYKQPKSDGKPKNKKRLARDKEQTKFYLLAAMDCFSTIKYAQAGCMYIPDEKIALGALKNREQHLHSLHRNLQRNIQENMTQIQIYMDKAEFPARRGAHCEWCNIPKNMCRWAKNI